MSVRVVSSYILLLQAFQSLLRPFLRSISSNSHSTHHNGPSNPPLAHRRLRPGPHGRPSRQSPPAPTPKAELVAAFTPAEKEIAWAKENLEPWGVKIYTDYDEMLEHEGLEAVCVATVTTVHAEQTIKAIEAGKHVLCEKPMSTKCHLSWFFRVIVDSM
jgi:hypothetical protein